MCEKMITCAECLKGTCYTGCVFQKTKKYSDAEINAAKEKSTEKHEKQV